MCGIALIISGTCIDLSSLLLDSVPSASSTSIDDQVGFSSFNFYYYIFKFLFGQNFSFLYLENKNLILTMCHKLFHNLIRFLDPKKEEKKWSNQKYVPEFSYSILFFFFFGKCEVLFTYGESFSILDLLLF